MLLLAKILEIKRNPYIIRQHLKMYLLFLNVQLIFEASNNIESWKYIPILTSISLKPSRLENIRLT